MAMKTNIVLGVSVCLFLGILVAADTRSPCEFQTIYNFGDSNSDTSAFFNNVPLVKLFPGKTPRIYCDGRLIVDFIAEKLGKSFLKAYRDKTDTTYGANFAVGGATIEEHSDSPTNNFQNQTASFIQFKSEAAGVRNIDFSKALFTLDIGQNSVTRAMSNHNVGELPGMINLFAEGVKKLYNEGARVFWIHNTGPQGCYNNYINQRGNTPNPVIDEFGCLKNYNDAAVEFNKQLKDKVVELRAELKDAAITYVDVYTPKYKLFSDGKKLGFPDPLAVCAMGPSLCKDPDQHVMWDTVHLSEAANSFVARSILDGKLSDPPLPITHACYATN